MKFENFITHIDNPEDVKFLRTPLFDVNMRLFKSSPYYRNLVGLTCNYIKFLCKTEMDGYKIPHGMSGANAAIPFNIIAYVKERNTPQESVEIMINPKITYYSKEKVRSKSNCGSIRLKEPIEIERSRGILVTFYDEQGNEHKKSFTRDSGSLTIQHEVDHNLGILITDRVPKEKEEPILN